MRRLPRPKTFLEQFSDNLQSRAQQAWMSFSTSPAEQLIRMEAENLRQVIDMNGTVQALMPLRLADGQ